MYKLQFPLKVRLNYKVVGLTKLNTTQKNIGLLCAVLKSDELQLSNVLAANGVPIFCSLELLHYVC